MTVNCKTALPRAALVRMIQPWGDMLSGQQNPFCSYHRWVGIIGAALFAMEDVEATSADVRSDTVQKVSVESAGVLLRLAMFMIPFLIEFTSSVSLSM
jgi:hypothetical protein